MPMPVTTQLIQFTLLPALIYLWFSPAGALTTASTLSCERAALGAESAARWSVSCVTDSSTASASALFDPNLVGDFYVNQEPNIAITATSDLNLSSTFNQINALTSTTITTFSLLTASGYVHDLPVSVVPTAFASLSSLQVLRLQDFTIADANLHLVLPSSIQEVSLVNCGLTGFSFEFADGSAVTDSSLFKIDLRANSLEAVPTTLYSLSADATSIDLRNNKLIDLSAENPAHKEQLSAWIDSGVLLVDDATIAAQVPAGQSEQSPAVTVTTPTGSGAEGTASPSATDASTASSSKASPSNEDENTTTTGRANDNNTLESALVITAAVGVPCVLLVLVALVFVMHQRRRKQDLNRDADARLGLPPSFHKLPRATGETSHLSSIEADEFSPTRFVGENLYRPEANDGVPSVAIAVTPDASNHSEARQPLTPSRAGYVNLTSPQDAPHVLGLTNGCRLAHSRDRSDSKHSTQQHCTTAPVSNNDGKTLHDRLVSRKALRSSLEMLLQTGNSSRTEISSSSSLLTVNDQRYVLSRGGQIQETPLAFFIECCPAQRRNQEDVEADTPPRLVLKFFVEQDAALVERESYALSCLHHDEMTTSFAPRLVNEALDFQLSGVNCSVLVLEELSCTTLLHYVRGQVDTSQQFSVVHQLVQLAHALQALHTHDLVHGGMNMNSLVVCPPDAALKFWGLECATKAGEVYDLPVVEQMELWQAEYLAPELAQSLLQRKHTMCASPKTDVWSFGVLVLKMYASYRQLDEFQSCSEPLHVLERLVHDARKAESCFFERSINSHVPHIGVKHLLRQCLQWDPTLRPSVESLLQHKVVLRYLREMALLETPRSKALSAIEEENTIHVVAREPEREASVKEVSSHPDIAIQEFKEDENELQQNDEDDYEDDYDDYGDDDGFVVPEPLPPSLWLFLPPPELHIDLAQRASFYSVDKWVLQLQDLQHKQRLLGDELRFPLIFMCENSSCSSTSDSVSPCQMAARASDMGEASVPASLLSLVMPLVRETMLFLEARAILSDGRSVGEASGLAGPHQWDELRTFYLALERMELATVNPVNVIMLTPLEEMLRSRDRAQAQQVLDELKCLVFTEDKREHVRSLLDALASDGESEKCALRRMQSGWATLRRCEVARDSSTHLNPTRWLCSHHAQEL